MPLSTPSKASWANATHAPKSNARTDLRMAEPKHRLGPQGTSNHLSLRQSDIPQSSVEAVRNICMHYVTKCAGKYQDNRAAARYVHTMSEEIMAQLAGVIEQINRFESEPEVYQSLLDEWKANFPPSLGKAGTPRAIASQLAKQADEINRLRSAMEMVKTSHKKEVEDVLLSMNSQLKAYRDGIVSERRQVAAECERLEIEHKDNVDILAHKQEKEILKIKKVHKHEMNGIKRERDKRINRLNSDLKNLEAIIQEERDRFDQERQALVVQKDGEIYALNQHIKNLQYQMEEQLKISEDDGASGMDTSFGDQSIITSEGEGEGEGREQEGDETEDAGAEGGYTDSEAGEGSRPRGGSKGKGVSKEGKSGRSKSGASRHPSAVMIKRLKLDKKILLGTTDELRRRVATLEEHLSKCQVENKNLHRRLHDADAVNAELRDALKEWVGGRRGDAATSQPASAPSKEEDPFILAHTPHYLMEPDRTGLMQNPAQVRRSPYVTAGHFGSASRPAAVSAKGRRSNR